jgi:hypothetical protein
MRHRMSPLSAPTAQVSGSPWAKNALCYVAFRTMSRTFWFRRVLRHKSAWDRDIVCSFRQPVLGKEQTMKFVITDRVRTSGALSLRGASQSDTHRGMKRSRAEGASASPCSSARRCSPTAHGHRGATDKGAVAPPEGHPKPCSRCRACNQTPSGGCRSVPKTARETLVNSAATVAYGDSSINDKYAFHDRDKHFCSRCIRFNFDNALLALRPTAMAVTGRAERSRCDRRVPNRARVRWRPEWRRY